ncbi:hypothetical protein H6A22_02365 [Collinsella intestinalis]|nr:hypothetical protein [Collinsella intestinalis]
MRREHLVQRYLWFVLGVSINSFAIALIAKSDLGVGAISCVAYVLAEATGLSFGAFTFIVNMLFIVAQVALLRRDFRPIQFLQVVVNIVFSSLIDVSSALLTVLALPNVAAQAAALLIGCALLALGIAIEVAPNVILVPGEGIVRAINAVTQKPFGSCKAAFDTSLVVIALALSLLLLGRVAGVGVGTVVSAVIVGRIVNVLNRHLPLLAHIAHLTRSDAGAPEEAL